MKHELEKLIIDEYFTNGFVGYKAVQKYKPEVKSSSASAIFSAMSEVAKNKEYIVKKMNTLRAESQIEAVQVLRELINFGYSDITDYIGLSEEELKSLPPDVRRCISQLETKTRTYITRDGKKVTEVNHKIKLVDKIKALEMINKHIGFYSADNKQKAANINLNNLPKATLNILLQNIES